MRIEKIMRLSFALPVLLSPSLAFAHTGIGEASGLAHGFMHPVSGLDHMLAMGLIGLLGWQMGGRARFLLPASFLSVMALGAALGSAGIALPFVELGIAASVVWLGLMLALRIEMPVAAAMALSGLFALFHGQAHGAEMPATAGGLAYGAGFLLSTALLHGSGLLMGSATSSLLRGRSGVLLRSFGALSAAAGFGLLTGLL